MQRKAAQEIGHSHPVVFHRDVLPRHDATGLDRVSVAQLSWVAIPEAVRGGARWFAPVETVSTQLEGTDCAVLVAFEGATLQP